MNNKRYITFETLFC